MDQLEISDESEETLPAINPDALARLKRFGGTKLLLDMISLYLVAGPERITAARAGVTSGNRESTELALHSLKSSSAQLGAMQIGRLSEEGEALVRSGTLDGVERIVAALEEEWERVQPWLISIRDGEHE